MPNENPQTPNSKNLKTSILFFLYEKKRYAVNAKYTTFGMRANIFKAKTKPLKKIHALLAFSTAFTINNIDKTQSEADKSS